MKAGPDVRLVAMCDIFRDQLDASRDYLKRELPDQVKVADDHGFVGFDGYKHVIETVDVVLIAVPPSSTRCTPRRRSRRASTSSWRSRTASTPSVSVGWRRPALARAKNLSILSGLHSRWHSGWQETVKRIHDGAIGQVVAIQSMFLRGPYRLNPRDPSLSETAYQFRNWYHFRWLSGDDVPQSLVHNMDRVSWVLKEKHQGGASAWPAGPPRSARSSATCSTTIRSFMSTPAAPGSIALCRTQEQCYGNSSDIIMGTKGTCHLGSCKIEGKNPWKYKGPQNDPYLAEQKALIDSVRTGKPINSGGHMNQSTLIGVMGQMACYSGSPVTWDDARNSPLHYGPVPEVANFDTKPPTVPDKTGNYPISRPGVTKYAGQA